MTTSVARTLATGGALVVTLFGAGFTLSVIVWPMMAVHDPDKALVFVVTVVAMIPWVARIWHRSRFEVAAYAACIAASICLWTAAGKPTRMFTLGQWRLLGFVFLALAATAWNKQRQCA